MCFPEEASFHLLSYCCHASLWLAQLCHSDEISDATESIAHSLFNLHSTSPYALLHFTLPHILHARQNSRWARWCPHSPCAQDLELSNCHCRGSVKNCPMSSRLPGVIYLTCASFFICSLTSVAPPNKQTLSGGNSLRKAMTLFFFCSAYYDTVPPNQCDCSYKCQKSTECNAR